MKPNKQRLNRLCKRCNQSFTPTGKFQRLCEKCLRKAQLNASDKRLNKEQQQTI